MFDHPNLEKYDYENLPLDEDCYLVDEEYMHEYEKMIIKSFETGEYKYIGYVTPISINQKYDKTLDLTLYRLSIDRLHDISISMPKSEFIICVGSMNYDEKPRIFVKNGWIDKLYLRLFSVYCYIDAAYFTKALKDGVITRDKLILLRDEIDIIAKQYDDIAFISFADNLILKSNWTLGHIEYGVKYTYKPEIFLKIFDEIKIVYHKIFKIDIYAVFTQGLNEYYEDPLLHISETRNHICLNSLGIPFAQTIWIENAAKISSKEGIHKRSEIYMDQSYFSSLKFKFGFDKETIGKNKYFDKVLNSEREYFYSDCQYITNNLRENNINMGR